MSVLLEALKKAAAEKKKAMDSSTIDSAIVVSDSNDVPKIATSSALKLATDDAESVTLREEAVSSSDDVQADTTLKFTLTEMSTPLSSHDDLDLNNRETSALSGLADAGYSESTSEDSSPLLALDESKRDELSFEQVESTQESIQTNPTEPIGSDNQNITKPVEEGTLETDKDSFEWSMNALPGYSSATMDESTPIEKNSILLTGALTSEPKAKKKIHSKWLLVLIVMLMFIGISVYGLIYYQEQNEQLENSMRRYELAKIQISLPKNKMPISNGIDSTLNKSKDSSNELESPSLVASSDILQGTEVSSIRTEQTDLIAPTSNGKPMASVNKISNSENKSKIRHSSTNKKPIALNIKPSYKPVLVQVNKTETTLSDAYKAYEVGDIELSQQKFSEVLAFDSKNITAMIGLGGVAALSGHYNVAMDYYQQALNVDPNSLEVYEAIANLSSNIELNSDWNDALTNMAKNYPNSATLQYALGNLYSSNNDWLAAQESYFNAYALDMNNPDFIVNLAISLDQLGKYPLAGQYYTQALALAGSKTVNFNIADIKNRLVSIRQFIDQEK